MYKLSAIVLLLSTFYYTQCIPTQSSDSVSQVDTGNKFQLYVNNGTEGINYHLTPVFEDLAAEDRQLDAELNAVWPYLNFLLGPADGKGLEDCLDQLEIQLIKDY